MEFMRIIMEFALPIVLVLFVITQIILPAFVENMPFFWAFKHGKKRVILTDSDVLPTTRLSQPEQKNTGTLDDAVEEVATELSRDADKLKSTKDKVDQTIDKLKSARDNSINHLNH